MVQQVIPNVVMLHQPGAGQTTIQLDETKDPTVANDVIVTRKSQVMDRLFDPDGYDTLS